jgi:hypothetical protein
MEVPLGRPFPPGLGSPLRFQPTSSPTTRIGSGFVRERPGRRQEASSVEEQGYGRREPVQEVLPNLSARSRPRS